MRLADMSTNERQVLLDHFKNNAWTNLGLSWHEFCVQWNNATQDEKKEIYQMVKLPQGYFH